MFLRSLKGEERQDRKRVTRCKTIGFFAKEPYEGGDILQKRRIILRSLLIVELAFQKSGERRVTKGELYD